MHAGPRLFIAAISVVIVPAVLPACSSTSGSSGGSGLAAFSVPGFRARLPAMPGQIDAVIAHFKALNAPGNADRSRAYTDYTRELQVLNADAQLVAAAGGDPGLRSFRSELRAVAREFRSLTGTLNDFQFALSKDMHPGTVLRIGAAYQPVLDQAAAVRAALAGLSKDMEASLAAN